MMIDARNVSWNAGAKPVLHPSSLTVQPGETLGLIGPNGSGKSTLLRLLAGLRASRSGSVRLNGRDMAKLPRREIAKQIALVEQQAETADLIRVRQVVELGRLPYLKALGRQCGTDHDAVTKALDRVEMIHMADRFWHTLSGGERQRVHIARALAQEPAYLLLDEPTNHLDIKHQIGILGLVKALPLTTVMVLHDLNHAIRYCDRLALLHEGKILAAGPAEKVLSPALIRQVFEVDAQIEPGADKENPTIRFKARAA
ncbi:ABC transporter ATP-binding protein [Aestuariispira insulae]|uniref:Iron complex transport system ATP-binding protein n=1 Tax=Aestuariispira insulae TaxID=1461337 RepID=A0A3D9HSH3_9PROT|nr:ABC transporter ATP-binding protein [Aestuariispira insulae]RED52291.1 iron complex transport system ATP-binding protein [Aestuariispira insulae]